jgi:hypothetical protein
VRLREERWRLRAVGLRKMTTSRRPGASDGAGEGSSRAQAQAQHTQDTQTLGKAEAAERAALQALQNIRPPEPARAE